MTDADGIDGRVGDAVRAARRERRLSTRQLAGLAGISQPTLSNIENGRIRAGVATLYLLAEALGVPPARFLSGGTPVDDGHGDTASDGVLLRALPAGAGAALEVYEITVPPGVSERQAFQHAGEDAVYVISGDGRLEIGERSLDLRPGDVLWIDATAAHRFTAGSRGPLMVQIVTARGRASVGGGTDK